MKIQEELLSRLDYARWSVTLVSALSAVFVVAGGAGIVALGGVFVTGVICYFGVGCLFRDRGDDE